MEIDRTYFISHAHLHTDVLSSNEQCISYLIENAMVSMSLPHITMYLSATVANGTSSGGIFDLLDYPDRQKVSRLCSFPSKAGCSFHP